MRRALATRETEGLASLIRPHLLKSFKPALLGRMNVVPYFPLGEQVLREIIEMALRRIGDRLRQGHRAAFSYDPAVVTTIATTHPRAT